MKGRPAGTTVPLRDLVSAGGFAMRLAWRADRRGLVTVVLVQVVTAIMLGAGLLVLQRLAGNVFGPGGGGLAATTATLVPVAAGLVLFGTTNGILRAVGNARQRVLTVQMDRHIIALVLRAATQAELSEFEDPEFHDRLQRAVFASRSQPVLVVTTVVAVLQTTLVLAAVAAAFVVMAWWLLPFALLSAVPAIKAARDERHAGYGLHRGLAENRRIRQYLERLMTGRDEAKEVRAFGLAPVLQARWDAQYADEVHGTEAMYRRYLRRRIAARLSGDLLSIAVITGVWWMVTRAVLDLPTALAALTGLWLLSARVQMMGSLVNNMGGAVLYLHDLRTFTVQPVAAPASASAPATVRTLSAVDIAFTYPGSDRPALRGVSMNLHAGQIVALVGSNGSGKTTLAKILGGLYLPDAGSVRRDGEPVNEAALLRAQTAFVFQDFVQYRLSAADNIAFGRPGDRADLAQVRAAASQAGAHDFVVRLRHGYDTVLSKEFSEGTDLSLGQWQRLAIARAFYRDAPFVILDEPTASLDPDAEAQLFAHIRDLFRGRTVLLISHRFSSVRHADQVYVLDQGRIVEAGTHESLIARDQMYARLYRTQAEAYQEVAG